MNIMFFLTPKSEVACVYDYFTLRQALEKMEYHRYTAIPILDREGRYVGTLTEGDLLWALKNEYSLNLKAAERVRITDVPRRLDNAPIRVDEKMEDLVSKAMNQNFVPVIDDKESFIGIITRKDIIQYLYKRVTDVSDGGKQ